MASTNPRHRTKTRPGGILKKSPTNAADRSEQSPFDAASSAPYSNEGRSDAKKRKATGIKWDERTIAEHDKDRGTRMRIVEPKTPYHSSRRSSFDSMGSGFEGLGASAQASDWTHTSISASSGGFSAFHNTRDSYGGDSSAQTSMQIDTDEWDKMSSPDRFGSSQSVDSNGDAHMSDSGRSDSESRTRRGSCGSHSSFEAARSAHYREEIQKLRKVRELMARKGKVLDDELDSEEEHEIEDAVPSVHVSIEQE